MTKGQDKNAVRVKLESAMARKGVIRFSDLAHEIGVKPQTIRKMACGYRVGRPTERRIEDFLNTPIWSTPDEFAARRQAASPAPASAATPAPASAPDPAPDFSARQAAVAEPSTTTTADDTTTL